MKSKHSIYSLFDFILTIFWIMLFILNLARVIDLSLFPYNLLDMVITLYFIISYLTRFLMSEKKKEFFLENIFDLVAILPFNLLTGNLLFSTNRIFRIINLMLKLGKKKNSFLYENVFIYGLYASACIIFVGSGFFSFFENKNYGESIWWSIETVTTLGYGDIIPKTAWGKLTASITMLFGLGFISLITSTITNYFSKNKIHKKHSSEIEKLHEKIDYLTKQVEILTNSKEKKD